MAELTKAERKAAALKRRENYGNEIMDFYFNKQKENITPAELLRKTNRHIDLMIENNPQEAELIRQAAYDVEDSFKIMNQVVDQYIAEKDNLCAI